MTEKIKPKILAISFTLFTIFLEATGFVCHGLLGMPSIMNSVYPGFWSNPELLLLAFVGSLVYAYIAGYIFALIYNWASKKF